MDHAPAVATSRLDTREHQLKAAPSDQQRLLELQAVDTRLDQLAHRRRTLPQHAEIDKLDRTLAELRDLTVGAETESSDLEQERVKADADVEQVRQRATRDQQRLDSGQVGSPRDLQNLQSEIASLARRQSALEDVELELMERIEDTQARLSDLSERTTQALTERAAASAARDEALAHIEEEASAAATTRGQLAGGLDGALLALYEKIRAGEGGTGAAALVRRRCSGCQLEVSSTDISRFRTADEDEVLRCEECRRILVRTPESGL